MAGGDKSLYAWVTEKGAVGGKVFRELAVGEDTYKAAKAAADSRANKRVKPKIAPDGSIVGYEVIFFRNGVAPSSASERCIWPCSLLLYSS
jgi:hypothetical protein